MPKFLTTSILLFSASLSAGQVKTLYNLKQIKKIKHSPNTEYILQLGAFAKKANALRFQLEFEKKQHIKTQLASRKSEQDSYRVVVGPFNSLFALQKACGLFKNKTLAKPKMVEKINTSNPLQYALLNVKKANTQIDITHDKNLIPKHPLVKLASASIIPQVQTENPEFPNLSIKAKQNQETLEKGIAEPLALYEQLTNLDENDKIELLNQIRAEIIHANYDTAELYLGLYADEFGEDNRYLTEKARLYSLNGKAGEALDILRPMLENDPTNDKLLDIQAYALVQPSNSQNIRLAEASENSLASNIPPIPLFPQSTVEVAKKDKKGLAQKMNLQPAKLSIMHINRIGKFIGSTPVETSVDENGKVKCRLQVLLKGVLNTIR